MSQCALILLQIIRITLWYYFGCYTQEGNVIIAQLQYFWNSSLALFFFLHVLPFYLVAFFDYHLRVSEGESVEQICSCESQTGDFGVVESSTADDARSEKDMNGERGCERSVRKEEVSVVSRGKRLRRRGKVSRDEAMRRGSLGAWAMRGESMMPVIKGERRVWWPERRILACSSLG